MDLSSRGCLLNERDGLILSSFQILDQGEEQTRENKENGVLDHFLHSLTYDNDNQFKDDPPQWKDRDPLSSSTQNDNVPSSFPLHLNGFDDHDPSILRSFQPQVDSRNTHDGVDLLGSDDIGNLKSNNEKHADEEECKDIVKTRGGEGDGREVNYHEEGSNLSKNIQAQESCSSLNICENTALREVKSKQLVSTHTTDYLDIQPALSHPVYIDTAHEGIWQQDRQDNNHQQNCLSGTDWDDPPSKTLSKKDDDLLPGIDTQTGDPPQSWDFLQSDDDQQDPHPLISAPVPQQHPEHQPHPHLWQTGISNGRLSHPVQHGQQQHQHPQRQWISGKRSWVHSRHPTDDGDKTLILSPQGQWAGHSSVAWTKEIDGGLSVDADVDRMHMFQITPSAGSGPSVTHSAFHGDMGHPVVCSNTAISLPHQQPWGVENHLVTGSSNLHPHQVAHPTMVHRPQPSTSNFFHDPLHLPASSSPGCHFQGHSMQPVVCNNIMATGEGRKARAIFNRRRTVSAPDITVSRCKSTVVEQRRPNSHPYLPKDPKLTRPDGFPACANQCNLKASHLVSWYIDYLIHENENLTQISRAFSLPVNLFHSDDFYFMDSVKKKAHFPSLKFLSWMQQKLPNINVNSVDFLEGRPPIVSMWNQDWFWQNKSRRDIIHDVFFYFQHRRVAYPN